MQRLQVLANHLESMAKVGALPRKTLHKALAHTDDVVIVGWSQGMVVDVPDLVLANGYTLFDEELDPLYTVDEDSGLEEKAFGTQPEDAAWFLDRRFGAYAYVAYVNASGKDRVIMVIRA